MLNALDSKLEINQSLSFPLLHNVGLNGISVGRSGVFVLGTHLHFSSLSPTFKTGAEVDFLGKSSSTIPRSRQAVSERYKPLELFDIWTICFVDLSLYSMLRNSDPIMLKCVSVIPIMRCIVGTNECLAIFNFASISIPEVVV